ncbi:hypothetical protein SEUCBS140593_009716 [Sporothrix eucalyptigena]|uniref:Steroid 5-alpha reductase C-terminal domain-containing protein n=1 Tax=Sporothrix eucalyptigena TaxID=1812306 RepID=A0ABP0CXR9_9PEZI
MAIHVLDKYYLGITAIITVAYQLVFFAIAFTCKFDKLTGMEYITISPSIFEYSHLVDFAGGSNFVVLAVITLVLGAQYLPYVPARQILVTTLLCLWALRLAGFLFFRILRTGKDTRFDDKRDKFFPFLGFWVAQMVWVWTVSLPVTILNSPGVISHANSNLAHLGTPRDIAGVVLFGVGFLCEAIADAQRFRFRERVQKTNPLAFCQSGLFAWSRHPNYFGEILVQFGIFIVASSDTKYQGINTAKPPFYNAVYASITGAVLLTLLLFFVSGMTLSERPAAAKRYAAGGAVWDAYRTYLHRTSILIPLPPFLYAPLPVWLKRTLLLEFPLYVFDPAKHATLSGDADGNADGATNSKPSKAPIPPTVAAKVAANPVVPPKNVGHDPDGNNPEPMHRKLPHSPSSTSSAPRRHDSL